MARLVWPIKRSFTAYIEQMNDGTIVLDAGAQRGDDGFSFPSIGAPGDAVTRFAGTVTFTGHYGMLYLPVAEIEIVEPIGGNALLTIADDESPSRRRPVLHLGEAVLRGTRRTYPSPVLTPEGAELFFDNYRAGSSFDPLEIREEDAA